jgi:hypothetical protein
MSVDKSNEDSLCRIIHLDYQPIFVATNVEDDSVITQDARTLMMLLNICRRFPYSMSCFEVPGLKRGSRIVVLFIEFF